MLHIERLGSGRRLALVHGFTQSGRAWGPVGDALSHSYEVLALDAPGHGRSAGVEADLPGGAEMMADTVMAVGGPATWLGYSMGGRYALHAALRRPEAVERLVLVSTTAGIDDPAERAARRAADDELADRVEAEGVEHFVRWWLTQPLFAGLREDTAQLEGRLDGTAGGLASSLRRAGTGTQEPLWARLREVSVPVLVVAGERDLKYVALAERLSRTIGRHAQLEIIPSAGHACHLEQPERFFEAVAGWLGDA